MSSSSSPEAEDSEELWLLNLQEFLETLQPELKEVEALTAIEEFLLNLESTDPNFHRYNFICQIRDQLDLQISPLIGNAMKDSRSTESSNSNGEILIASFDKILTSKEFEHISYSINESVQTACKDIYNHLQSDTFDFSSGNFQKYESKHGELFNGNASICSTTDGVDFMFMPPDKYKHLAQDINQHKDINSKIKSLTILQQVPQADLVASEAWIETRKGLLRLLDDENEEVHMRVLKLISRLFLSGNSHVAREYFLVLVENLINHFTDTTSHFIFLDTGLDLGDRRNVLIIKKFQLLNNIQKEMPTMWVRYSEKYVEEIINSLIYLLGISPNSSLSSEPLMNPLMFLSLVDPQAIWFRRWMHGFYSRVHLIKVMAKHTSFFRKPLKSCVNMCRTMHNNSTDRNLVEESDNEFIYTSTDLSYTYFLHSINVLHHLLLYKDSRKLLNFDLSNGKTMSIAILMNAFVDILRTYPNVTHCSSKSLYHAGYVTAEIFHTLANAGMNTVASCLCYDRLYESFMESLQDVSNNEKSLNDTSVHLVVGVLAEIAVNKQGCVELLKKRKIDGVALGLSVIDVLCKVFIQFDTSTERALIPSNILLNLLLLFQRLLAFPEGLLVLRVYNVSAFLCNCYKEQINKTNFLMEKIKTNAEINELKSPLSPEACPGSGSSRKGGDNIAYKKSIHVEKQILDTILHFTLTPKGVSIFLRTEFIDNCMMNVHNKYKSKEHLVKTVKNGYGILLHHIAATRSGINAILKSGYVRDLLEQIWMHIEGCVNNYTLTVLDEIPQDLTNLTTKKLFMSAVELLSTFNSVTKLFAEELVMSPTNKENNNTDSTNGRSKGLKRFNDLINNLVLLDSSEKLNLLYHPEQTHLFALNILSFIVTSLDSMLCLQAQFHFQEFLLKLQAECQHDNNSFVIDQCSVKRNQILVQSYLLGGSNERKVPMDTLTEDVVAPYPWPLFCTYPVPGVYSFKGFISAVGAHNKETCLRERLAECDEKDFENKETRNDFHKELQDSFVEELQTKTLKARDDLVPDLLVQCNNIICMNADNQLYVCDSKEKMKNNDSKTTKSPTKKILKPEEKQAIDMMVRYGLTLRQLRSQNDGTEGLKTLLQTSKSHFQNTANNFSHVTHDYHAFDWFAGVIYLLFSGDEKKAWSFMERFSTTMNSLYLWPARILDLVAIKEKKLTLNDIHPIFNNTCHFIECILEKEFPQIHAAFILSGYPPSQICHHWIRQCFLNYLDWDDIVMYFASCIVLGIDYQVYICVAILKHLEKKILLRCQNDDLLLFLRNSPIIGFQISGHIEFMKELELKYRETILEDLLDWTQFCE